NANINYKLGLCYLKSISEKSKALNYLEKAVLNTTTNYNDIEPQEKKAPINALYYYGQALHFSYRFDEAIAHYEKFKSYLSKQKDLIADVNRQIEISNNAKTLVAAPINVIIKNLGDSVNSGYSDHSPVLSADENTLIFTSRRPGSTGGDRAIDDQFYEDIYISFRKPDSTWTTPVSISANVNTNTHEATVGLTADGQTLLIYKDSNGGDIYYSTLDGENWTFPQAMGSDINSPNWETSACLTPDGNTLFFVSNRKEGGMGGRDIWKCVKLPNGKWSKAVNLGAPINTPYDEESPFIHPSGNILFFSSNGHKTIGGFDIFFSTRNEGNWEEPLNIGYPINTTDDDVFYVTSPDGKRGYYASSSRAEGFGEKDLYLISIPERKEQPLVLIKGFIVPADGQKLPNDIEIIATNNESGIITGVYKPLMRDGSFTIIIPPGSNYTLSYQQDGQEFFTEIMEVPADAAYQEINKEVKLKPVNFGQAIPVNTNTNAAEQTNTSKVAYVTVEGRLLDENNKPLNALKVNLMDENGSIIKTTTSDELGWFFFNELPSNRDYVVGLDENDPHFIGKKSFVEFKDEKGTVLKTKNIGQKYILEKNKTSVAIKNHKNAVQQPINNTKPTNTNNTKPIVHEQLASVEKLNFKMNFKYNVTQIDENDTPFNQYIANLIDLYNQKGTININLISSASTVPTRAFKSNKELSIARSEKAKEQLIVALKAKGVDESKIIFIKINSIIDGPKYNSDYLINRDLYEKYQFIKISAY
ncbi:MAG: PD40 domain-containing protein, partial [Bacteroidia bacterium]|nr:PD40 domain-containing protein [Bacteroidia bacterium]